jgi:hypothetical protein
VTYYAVSDANGPVSVKLDGATEAEAVASFGTLDPAAAIDGCHATMVAVGGSTHSVSAVVGASPERNENETVQS